MTFEQIIKKVSATVSAIAVFLMVGFLYLNAKGFDWDENGNFVLVNQAMAAENEVSPQKDIPLDYAFPQDHVLGENTAPVVLYEYSSFGCFHCADFHLEVLPQIKQEYIDKGLVKLVFVPLPLDKNSMDAALLSECVEQDKYFEFINVLFKKQRDWQMAFNPQKVLTQYAALSGVGNEKASACLKDDKTAARILKDRQSGLSDLGISGTPSFVVSSAKANKLIPGLVSLEAFKSEIDAHLPESK